MNDINIENSQYLKNIPENNISRFSPAPLNIPKYSIHNSLLERDEFRKSVEIEHYNNIKSQKRNEFLNKFLAFMGVSAGVCFLHFKKII